MTSKCLNVRRADSNGEKKINRQYNIIGLALIIIGGLTIAVAFNFWLGLIFGIILIVFGILFMMKMVKLPGKLAKIQECLESSA